MKQRHTHATRDYGSRYADALRELAGAEGRRHRMLLGVANRGLWAGRTPAEIETDLLEAGEAGRSPLTAAEVRDAVQRAEATGNFKTGTPRRIPAKSCGRALEPGRLPRPPRRGTPVPHYSAMSKDWFIEKMLGAGEAEWSRWRDERLRTGLREWETPDEDLHPLAALQAFSPVPLDADTLPRRMAALQVAALFEDETERLYAGPLEGARNPANVYGVGDFLRRVRLGEVQRADGLRLRVRLPTHILANPITGEPGPTGDLAGRTYKGNSTVAAFRHIVVEFDGMDAPGEKCRRQALFWLGVVTSQTKRGRMLLPVRCLVFSGSKSIHAVLRRDSPDRDRWETDWEKLAAALPGLDDAFHTPSQCMRLAGAVRTDEKAHGAEQTLLWCCRPYPHWNALLSGDAP